METHTLKREIPVNSDYDVIVAGGGPAGCTAAAAAAREGVKTLLIESTGALGGMGTSGLVPAWCPFTDKEKIIYSGLAEKVLKDTMAGMPHVPEDRFDWTPIDPERLKRVYDDLVTENGADILFNTFMSALEAEDGTVSAVICANKAGLTAYKAKVFVDCTGDADIAAWAGAEFQKGDETGDIQPATHCFILSNVDMYAYTNGPMIRTRQKGSIIDRILEGGKYPEIPDAHACNSISGPGSVGFNAGHIWDVDNTKPETVSKALVEGRKMADAFRRALKEYFPEAFGNAWLSQTGSLLGIRETRRIVGDYTVTIDDFKELRSFDDEICRNCYYIDVHHKKCEVGTDKARGAESYHLDKGQSHGIPYRSLIPKGLKNVLVAGRSISTDRPTQGSTRVMPVCLAMGEGAGAAAGMAAAGNGEVREVDTDKLRSKLKKYGAYLP